MQPVIAFIGLLLLSLVASGLTTAIGCILRKKSIWISGLIVLCIAGIISVILLLLINQIS